MTSFHAMRNLPPGFYTWSAEARVKFMRQVDEADQVDADRRRKRTEERALRRVADALRDKWNWCCIPGCNARAHAASKYGQDPAKRLPICFDHAVLIADDIRAQWESDDVIVVRAIRAAREATLDDQADAQAVIDDENHGHKQGHVYFVRVGPMIKVGWSSKLRSRLKQYGASAEVLCHFPGTRQDETTLHRQLRPQLAAGREWYHDNDVLAGVVADYLKRHGRPTVLPTWPAPRPDAVAKKRHAA